MNDYVNNADLIVKPDFLEIATAWAQVRWGVPLCRMAKPHSPNTAIWTLAINPSRFRSGQLNGRTPTSD